MKIVFMTSGTIKSSLSYRPLSLAKELVKSGHEIYIITPRFDKYSSFKDEGVTTIEGITIVRPLQIKAFSFEFGLLSYIVSSFYLLMRLKPDIIHMFKPNPITLPALAIKLLKKTPVILDTDDLDSEVMKIENNSTLRIKLVDLSEMIAARCVDGITVGSRYLRTRYRGTYKNKPISYIPNGADFTDTGKMKVKKLSTNRIVFLGNMNRKNILEPLFHALRDIKQRKIAISVTIIGDGTYLGYFKRLSKKLEISHWIQFLGYIPHDKLHTFIKTGDLGYCYMPNEETIKACSSMKVFQYMQYGAVPLVSNVGDLPLYTFNGEAGYIAKHSDNNSLTKTIIASLSTTKEKQRKVTFAIGHAKKMYKWSVLARKMELFYQEIL